MFAPKQKHPLRFCLGRLSECRRWMPVVCVSILLAKASGQDAATNTGTNQPGRQTVSTNQVSTNTAPIIPAPAELTPTNPAPIELVQTPSLPPTVIGAQNSLTDQFGVLVNPPPLVGPTSIGSPRQTTPLLGTSIFGAPLTGLSPAVTGPGIPLWGPIDIHPRLLESFTYGNGVQAQPGVSSQTAVDTVAPGFLLDLGEHWTIDYNPSFIFYSSPLFKNAVDESAVLRGFWACEDWTLSLSQGYSESTAPLVETGTQTAQEGYITAINAAHQMADNLSLDLAVNQNFRLSPGFTDLHEWTTADWLNYRPNTMFGLGLGLTLGYDDVSVGSDAPFEELQGRIKFDPGPKLSITITGGVSDRQFIDPSGPPLISPIYSASLTYQVFEPTLITLSANRSVSSSFYSGETEEATSYNVSLHQQLSPKLSLAISCGYSTMPLTSTGAANASTTSLETANNNTITSGRVSFSYLITDRASLSISYLITDNASSQAALAYSSRQFGFYFNYRY